MYKFEINKYIHNVIYKKGGFNFTKKLYLSEK